VSGIKKNYDCDSTDDLIEAVTKDINVEYFPSVNEDNKVVPEPAKLTNDVDYEVEFVKYNDAANIAEFRIKGKGSYTGDQSIQVPMNSAVVTKAPVGVKDLIYNGQDQALVERGKAKIGEMPTRMQYGIGTKTRQPDSYSSAIPTAKNAGKYYVWYRAAGDKTHAASQAQRLERPVAIAPMEVSIDVEDMTVEVGKTATITPELTVDLPAVFSFDSDDTSVATVNNKGVVKGIKEGETAINIHAELTEPSQNYIIDYNYASIEVVKAAEAAKVVKAANPLKVSQKTATVKRSRLKKKAQTLAITKVIRFSKKANDKKNYKLLSVKKGKKSFKKYFKINKKTGKVTIKKNKKMKKGIYKVKVRVKALGNSKYKPSSWKTVTFKVKVK